MAPTSDATGQVTEPMDVGEDETELLLADKAAFEDELADPELSEEKRQRIRRALKRIEDGLHALGADPSEAKAEMDE